MDWTTNESCDARGPQVVLCRRGEPAWATSAPSTAQFKAGSGRRRKSWQTKVSRSTFGLGYHSCRDKMPVQDKEPIGEVETALLDADLFLKYGSPDRAMKRLKTALERMPRSISLREKLREVAAFAQTPRRSCATLSRAREPLYRAGQL
jgi:hypothetical protein